LFRVIIVDDEPLVRIALRELIAWEEHNCEVIAEAADGEEALRLVQQGDGVDLIVMDIHMPRMDGITCLEELQKLALRQKPLIIVLSAYSEYDYVRKAFLLGAVDYIVKTHMEAEPMNAVIRGAVAQLVERMQQAEKVQREQLAQRQKLREAGLIALLKGTDASSFIDMMSEKQEWTRSDMGEQVLVCILVDDTNGSQATEITDDQTARYTVHMIRQALEGNFADVAVLSMRDGEVALLLFIQRYTNQGQLSVRNQVSEGMDRIVSHLKQYVNLSVSIGVSDITHSWDGWYDAYQQAYQLANMRYFAKEGRVFYPEHATSTYQLEVSSVDQWDRKELLRRLEAGEPWQEELSKGFRYWNTLKTKSVMDIQKMYQAFLWELGALLHARNLDWQDVLGQEGPPYERLPRMHRMADVHEWLNGLVSSLAFQLDPRRLAVQLTPRLVDKAKTYIDLHYHEPISLSSVSRWVGVSESHLSKQFTKETGENFIAYITNIRIQNAIHMMWGGMKLFEIAEKVGYPNQGHFSRMFKKVTGRTPQQYREDCRL
jgi:two-component system response regulator YesN